MNLLLEQFELLTRAPENVAKLKGLILQLAVRGKLVEQDPADEPASELLKRIQAEKARLIAEGKIKKEKPLPPIAEDEIPYALPEGWVWCRLGEICHVITDGTHHTPTYTNSGIPFLSVKNVSKGYLSFSDTRFISLEEHELLIKRCHPEYEDILLTKVGTTGIAKMIDTKQRFSIFVSLALLKFNKTMIYPFFLENVLNSPIVKKQSDEGTEGVGNKNLVLRKIKAFMVPFSPFNEQKRIVARVERLLTKVDALVNTAKQVEQQRQKLGKSALFHLGNAKNFPETQAHWHLLENHFSDIFCDAVNVKELRQTILQLAVQGKLVPQDSSDEPASELLKRIKAEKTRLIAEGKIKKEKPLPPISEGEIPYALPEGWVWCRLGAIGQINPRNAAKASLNVSFIPMKMISEKYGVHPQFEEKKWREIKKGYTHFQENDVVVAKITPCFENSKAGVMKNLINGIGAGTTELHVFRGNPEMILPQFVYIYFKSPKFLHDGEQNMTGTAGQKRIPKDYVTNNLFSLPPFNEQKRIVAKVERLMRLCDRLEAQVTQSKQDAERLMQAVLKEAFAGEEKAAK